MSNTIEQTLEILKSVQKEHKALSLLLKEIRNNLKPGIWGSDNLLTNDWITSTTSDPNPVQWYQTSVKY